MASLKYEGNSSFQTGTLGSSYTSGGSSMSLTSGHGARFPSSGDFWIRVDDEILKVTARSTDTLTVSGAQDGTSADNHSSGATVRWVLSKSALDQLRSDIVNFSQVTASTANTLTVSSTWTDVDSMSCTIELDAAGNLECFGRICFAFATTNWRYSLLRFLLDGSTASPVVYRIKQNTNAQTIDEETAFMHYIFTGVSSGSHTVKIQWQEDGSSVDVRFNERGLVVKKI